MNNKEKYILARWCYAIGEDFISDVEYDRLHREMQEEPDMKDYTERAWSYDSCPVDLLKRYNMAHLIEKIVVTGIGESIPSLNSDDDVKEEFFTLDEPTIASYKIDGWNTTITYFNGQPISANSRGRSSDSIDMSSMLAIIPKTISIPGTVVVVGELCISKKDWNIYKEMTGNTSQRASVRTAVASKQIDFLSFLAFAIEGKSVPKSDNKFTILKQLGFKTPTCMICKDYNSLKIIIKMMSLREPSYPYPNDGIVVENKSKQYAIRVGAWKEEALVSTIIGYDETPGLYGTSLQVKCEPVTVNGVTYSTISVNNIAKIIENDLRIGSKIVFSIRSSVYPVLDEEETRKLRSI